MNDLAARDLRVLWHPCTQMQDHEWLPMIPIARGDGPWLVGVDGQRYFDGVSSWWVNLFGHAHPAISAAVADQARRLEHVILAGFTHEPAIELAEKLIALAGTPFARVFYADSGSAAIEVALKMSFHFWLNVGKPKKQRFVVIDGGYHGETLGALSMTQVPLYRQTYGALLLDPIVAPSPSGPLHSADTAAAEHAARALERILEQQADEIAAIVVEPLVQCAAGMHMHDARYLARLRELCDRFGVHWIADEIAVGFGRTGTLFAHQQAGVKPDFLCLAKGLTGGYLPLSAVLTSDPIYQAFYDDYRTLKAFLHSHSYTGNPLACAAALATLRIFAEQPVLENNARLGAALDTALADLATHPNVSGIRRTGMIAAFDLTDADGRAFPWEQRRGLRVYRHALGEGALLRPLGNTVYFMPPYVASADQLRWLVGVAAAGVEHAVRD
jgi:adenosylmethionine-8-amino-7-oxononanoate aminotransferase